MSTDGDDFEGGLPEVPLIHRIELPTEASIKSKKKVVRRAVWRNRLFEDMNGHAVEFIDCDFSYSIFQRGYFRDAAFKNCRFIGCQFYDSNFKGANFYLCDLQYVRFYRCQIEAKSIIPALPREPNIRQEALQNLRANAAEIGDFASQRLLVLQEIAASKDHHWRAVIGTENYYQQKYSTAFSKIAAGWTLMWLHISSFIWGNGERPWKIFFSGFLLLAFLTLINLFNVIPHLGWSALFGVLRYTTSIFFDLDADKNFQGLILVDYALASMRYLYVGLYISVLYKIISHR